MRLITAGKILNPITLSNTLWYCVAHKQKCATLVFAFFWWWDGFFSPKKHLFYVLSSKMLFSCQLIHLTGTINLHADPRKCSPEFIPRWFHARALAGFSFSPFLWLSPLGDGKARDSSGLCIFMGCCQQKTTCTSLRSLKMDKRNSSLQRNTCFHFIIQF